MLRVCSREMPRNAGLGDGSWPMFGCTDGDAPQIAPAKTVPGLGEVITSRRHCLVPRAFFKHSAKDKDRLQASHASRVLAGAYGGE